MNTTMLSTECYLIMPVQRLPRYEMLLRDLRKYTEEVRLDYNKLGAAITYIQWTISELNKNINLSDEHALRKLLKIAESIDGEENLLKQNRCHIFDGVLCIKKLTNKKHEHKKVGDKLAKNKDRHYAFLFTDVLVFCAILANEDSTSGEKPFSHIVTVSLGKIIDIISKDKKKNWHITLKLEDGEFWKLSCTDKYWIDALQSATKKLQIKE